LTRLLAIVLVLLGLALLVDQGLALFTAAESRLVALAIPLYGDRIMPLAPFVAALALAGERP
jgi:hypothetical protein